MLYRVHVASEQGPIHLDFLLDSNPLVDQWLECVQQQLSRPWKVNHLQWTRSWTTAATLLQAQQDLAAICATLDLDPTQDVNALHAQFQNYYENGGAADANWDRLNQCIHKLEEQERSLNRPQAQRTGFGMVLSALESNHVEQRPITLDLRRYWVHLPTSGDLLLGYYTLGKTLADCVRDNDQDCVRLGMVRAQQQISTEVMCLWSPEPSIIKQVLTPQQVAQWVKDHALESYIDIDLLEHRYAGTPRLGRYAGSYTPDQINDYLSRANITGAELID